MNGIRLIFRGQKGGVLSALTLFVVLGAVLLALNYALSQYLYIRRAPASRPRAGPPGEAGRTAAKSSAACCAASGRPTRRSARP